MNFSLLDYKKNIIIFLFYIFVLYNTPNIFNYILEEEPFFELSIQTIQGQLQQQTDFIKYQYQSDFIKEFEIPLTNNET